MPRFKLTIEYDGRPYVGWQRQENGLGVQQVVEEAIQEFAGEAAPLYVAGRTDAGVHALGQVAHVDLEQNWETDTVRDAINFHVKPHPISVLTAEIVDQEFHARFSACGRSYRYRIVNRRPPPTLDRGRVWWVPTPLDANAMSDGASVLTGNHDFSTFRDSECQAKSAIKTLDELTVTVQGQEIRINARARSFLHHQVRNMVGTLRLLGEGKWTRTDLKRALDAKDRTKGGPTAPPDGLYLVSVEYRSID